jgi:hypothetical protein
MLRITQNSHSGGAKGYYSMADHYLGNEQELTDRHAVEAAREAIAGNCSVSVKIVPRAKIVSTV